jgi:hypothetical protein
VQLVFGLLVVLALAWVVIGGLAAGGHGVLKGAGILLAWAFVVFMISLVIELVISGIMRWTTRVPGAEGVAVGRGEDVARGWPVGSAAEWRAPVGQGELPNLACTIAAPSAQLPPRYRGVFHDQRYQPLAPTRPRPAGAPACKPRRTGQWRAPRSARLPMASVPPAASREDDAIMRPLLGAPPGAGAD